MPQEDNDTSLSYSAIVPVYNEAETIERCLDSLLATDLSYPDLEILVVDGQSKDQTPEIVSGYIEDHRAVRLLENPQRTTPTGFNTGFAASQNDVIVLISGHSRVGADFFSHITQSFEEQVDADVVGGRMIPVGETYVERAIANALTTPVGASSSRFKPVEGYVETVNFGAYRRYVFEDVGTFDTGLPRAQDYEYNRRVRDNGYRIYQNPSIKIYYTPRSSYRGLAKQYYGNGRWKTQIFRKYGDYPVSTETLAILSVVAFLVGINILAVIASLFVLFGTLGITYVLAVFYFASDSLGDSTSSQTLLPGVVVALLIMHTTFGIGLVHGTIFEPAVTDPKN